MPFHPQIRRHAASHPGKPAIVIDGRTRTYGELAHGAKAFAAFIAALPGDRGGLPVLNRVGKVVALDLGNHLLFPELFVGASDSRSACAVLDPKMLPAQVEDILQRLRPDLIVTETMDSPAARIAARLGLRAEPVQAFEHYAPRELPSGSQAPAQPEDDTFLVNFTSGTTSQPKAYIRSRASWRASLARGVPLFGLQDAPVTLCPGALAHGLALYALSEALHSGSTFHTVGQWNADAVAGTLRRDGIERLIAVPTMISGLAERAQSGTPVFPSVRDVLTAGAKLNGKHIALMRGMFPNARLMEYYGASELGFVSVSTLHPPDPGTPLHTVGRAFPGVEIGIRPSADEAASAHGAAGTIYVKSDLICDGYLWGDDGKAFRVDAHGATVGDIGELEPNGALKVMGREGGMVITGGFNVYPSEVEAVLKSIAGVDEAIVLGVADAHLGARLAAVLRGSFDAGALLAEAAKALPRYKIPRDFYGTDTWPMTTSGKIARGQVAQLLKDGHYGAIELPR